MDPYIEHPEVWSDFQGGLAADIRAELNKSIRPRYVARLAPREVIATGVPLRLLTVEIIETGERQLVTAIEILSPEDKQLGTKDHVGYLRKRRQLLCSPANLIEIDLLRAGRRPPLERPVPAAPYYVVLSREQCRPTVDVWPIQLADALPTISVPLSEPDPDAALDLGALVAAVYERGGYDMLIDYSQPPLPPLSDAEAAWLDAYLRTKSMR